MANSNSYTNPSDELRHQLLRQALERDERLDDYDNIIALLNPPPEINQYAKPGSLKNKKIGIIGAGLTGLAAAYELRKLGADITIYEASMNRIGGRVYTIYFDKTNHFFGETGAMRIPVSHETTWHYINLFGLATESLTSLQSNNILYAHGIRLRRERSGKNIEEQLYPLYNLTEKERNTPWPVLSDYASSSMLKSLTPALRTEILKILPEYSKQYADITRLSTREVYEQLGLSQEAINLISAVEPFNSALLSVSHDEAMNSEYTLDFLNTYRIQGGMINLPNAFYQSLTNKNPPELVSSDEPLGNVTFLFGSPVNKIEQTLSLDQITLYYNNPANEQHSDTYDYVICTTPFSTLREIDITPSLSNQKTQAIKELNYCDAQKTLFLCKERFWEKDDESGRMNGGISFTDLPIQSIVYPPDHIHCMNTDDCSYHEPGVLVASYNLGQDSIRLSNQDSNRRYELIKREVEQVHGLSDHYLDDQVVLHKTVHWSTEYWARGAFACSNPGQKINFLHAMIQPEYNNHLYFAGEHASTKQGWMQGALYSGKFTANVLAKQLS
ncbi:flavin monoamine oxidase family protein [Anaeromicropila herbilytica]|uniref:Amine oxidase n=1 Tax=Anaeromicropila herbilytica TaxID=2785025 RepID=A0A7R7EPC4_9FIRM|nr:NAD(P)/FAD-dependent oxidoreductase [Anaeromicropila herbilytica]BCN32162.1 amine oxidase [Anaeromicropila herbilytica]